MITRAMFTTSAAMIAAACSAVVADPAPIEVVILQDGRLSVEGQVVTSAELRHRAPEAGVLLRADHGIQFAQFQAVMSDLEGLHIPIALVGSEAQ